MRYVKAGKIKLLPLMRNLISNILQLTESKYCTQNQKYLPFCGQVYFETT